MKTAVFGFGGFQLRVRRWRVKPRWVHVEDRVPLGNPVQEPSEIMEVFKISIWCIWQRSATCSHRCTPLILIQVTLFQRHV